MKDKILILALLAVGIVLGYLLGGLCYDPEISYKFESDTTTYDTTIVSWQYNPVVFKEIKGEVVPTVDDTTKQGNIHKIGFTVKEGVADIDYNVDTRIGDLNWTPSPVRREHEYTFQNIYQRETIETKPAVKFHTQSFTYGCVTGAVGTVVTIIGLSRIL